jgi:hypothetical protein
MMAGIEIGRALRSSITGCVVGCRVSQLDAPEFGGMVSIPLDDGSKIFGLITDIHIDDDGLVRQLVTAENISSEVIEDNRLNRNVPVEISVLFIGFEREGSYSHLLPPRPPLSLLAIYPCGDREIGGFTSAGRLGYLRHILRAVDLPVAEILAAHLRQAGAIQNKNGNGDWVEAATRELITLLRDDYATLNTVLGSLADTHLYLQGGSND